MKEIIGKKIVGLQVSDGERCLSFVATDGRVTYHAVGDCCSESWFADIIGVQALIGGTVISVDEVDLPQPDPSDGRSRQESDSLYGYKITTDKGFVDIAFRCSSNGYYGGWLEPCEGEPPEK